MRLASSSPHTNPPLLSRPAVSTLCVSLDLQYLHSFSVRASCARPLWLLTGGVEVGGVEGAIMVLRIVRIPTKNAACLELRQRNSGRGVGRSGRGVAEEEYACVLHRLRTQQSTQHDTPIRLSRPHIRQTASYTADGPIYGRRPHTGLKA